MLPPHNISRLYTQGYRSSYIVKDATGVFVHYDEVRIGLAIWADQSSPIHCDFFLKMSMVTGDASTT